MIVNHVIIFVSLVVAVAPMIAMVFFIWWLDRYDREPLKYVFGAYLWGGFGAVFLSIVGTEIGIKAFGEIIYNSGFDFTAVVIAPFIEELMKGLVVFFLLRYRQFDNVTDGLVYGAASGLGFGMTENFLYFIQLAGPNPGYDWLNLLFIRSIMTANMHCAASATFGAGISMLKDNGVKGLRRVFVFYLMAVFLHGAWNYLVTSRVAAYWGLAVMLLFTYIVIIFIIFILEIRRERKQRESILLEEFDIGVLPLAYKKVLMSYAAMRKGDWFPEYLNKNKYLSLVSRLALRKSAYFRVDEKRKVHIKDEIVEIRKELVRFSELIQQFPTDRGTG